ncbi:MULTISPECIES: Gfo/Idh/MocA family protein [Microbacterium]|uniref:Gfo/Idh/MocA family protein n=1 Tax=Microbacterium TaxID=33882 RepID=UPI001E2BB744|nr:Gfo/Idh/MocA family oxidoreductase [Microbacterium nymphoidis]MCD2499968.1 Gfo/Idh/MocA family oxidoreductase [Microbacterium nymphoidis]
MTDIAIVGAGFIGGVHARLIDSLDGARVSAVVDTDVEKAALLAGPRGARVAGSLDELAAAGALPAVVSVCTVSAGHADLAVRALELGCDVLVEKPIDITLDAAARVAEAAERTGRTVGVVSQRRFLDSSAALRQAIDAGRLGHLTGGTVESPFFRPQSYYDSGDWRGTRDRDGGGALMNQGIHALDLLLWFLGEAATVTAAASCVAHERIEVEDVVGAAIGFASGAVGTVFASTAAFPESGVRLSVFGTEGSATVADGRLTLRFADGEEIVDDSAPEGWTSIDWAHRAQYADLLDARAAGRAPAIGLPDGRRALAAVLGIYESARTARTVSLT